MPIMIQQAKPQDVRAINEIFRAISNNEIDVERVRALVRTYPSAVAMTEEGVVGFCYSASFAPDILEILNIGLSKKYRSLGLGSLMLAEVEKQASDEFRALILVNSVLYSANHKKALATAFYMKNGYTLVHTTGYTNVFIKKLRD